MNLNQKLQVWQATSESSSKFQQAPLKCKSTPNIRYESQNIKESKEQNCRFLSLNPKHCLIGHQTKNKHFATIFVAILALGSWPK